MAFPKVTKKKPKFTQILKILLGLVSVFSLFLISEIFYVANNRPDILSAYHLYRSQVFARRLDTQKSLTALIRGAERNVKSSNRKYPGLIPHGYDQEITISKNSGNFNSEYLTFILGLDPKTLIYSNSYDMARIFYILGLIAFKNNEADFTVSFWKTAIYLNPELSHLHVELSNFYLSKGDVKKAQEALNFCFKFKSPVTHCRDYEVHNFTKGIFEKPGFLEKELEKYYSSK